MKYFTLSSLALSALLFQVVSASLKFREEVCYTKEGSKSVKHVPTAYRHKTIKAPANTITFTKHATITATPAPTTITVIGKSTSTVTVTGVAESDTFTTTSTSIYTVYETDTSTSTTITSTEVDTVTTTSTSTSSVPPGFTPIQSSTAPPSSRKRNGGAIIQEEEKLMSRSQAQVGCKGKKYPESVKCVKVYISQPKPVVKTVTGTPATVTAAPSTSTKTSTITSTFTSAPPAVETTITLSTTETVTSTSHFTTTTSIASTTTVTETATATALAACGADNYVKASNVFNRGANRGSNFVNADATDQYDCCSQCQTYAGCSGSAYYASFSTCLLLLDNTCPADGSSNGVAGFYTVSDVNNFAVSNGACYTYYQSQ